VKWAGTADGTPVDLYACNGTAAQNWSYENGAFVGLGGKCLDVSGGSATSGTKVQVWTCNGTRAQKWTVSGATIVNATGKCLDVTYANSANGTPVQIWDCNGTAAQKWSIGGNSPLPPPASSGTPPPAPPPSTGLSPVDMSGWSLAFEDTFAGTALDTSKWREYGTAPSGSPPIYFNNAGISVHNGFVGTIWSSNGQWYGPGLQTYTGLTYYRAEIRAQIPKGDGVGPYFLMWPQNNDWPPEFDLVEAPGATNRVMTTWHWKDASGHAQYDSQFYAVDRTGWHTYTVEHTSAGFRYWIDGVAQAIPAAWNQNSDTHVMNFGIGAVAFPNGSSWFGGIDSSTPNPYHFYVSYVRMWKQG
jgi:hypothetical protein